MAEAQQVAKRLGYRLHVISMKGFVLKDKRSLKLANLSAMPFRKDTSIAKRVAITLIAICALLLQGVFAVSAAASGSFEETACTQNGFQPEKPGGEHAQHHGMCCILACAACSCASITDAVHSVVLPVRRGSSTIVWTLAPGTGPRVAAQFNSPARGPPQTL